jgi:ribosomal protein L20
MVITVNLAETILKVYSVLNESNKKQLAEMANKDKEHFGKVIDFAQKHLK